MIDKKNENMVKKAVARLACVQILYAHDINSSNRKYNFVTRDVIKLYHSGDMRNELDIPKDRELLEPDEKFLIRLIDKIKENIEIIDKVITENLSANWSLDRIGQLFRAILRSAISEILFFPDVPTKAIINEYVSIGKSLVNKDQEIGFLNGMIDNIARKYREDLK